jgi:hypothetical protein
MKNKFIRMDHIPSVGGVDTCDSNVSKWPVPARAAVHVGANGVPDCLRFSMDALGLAID